MHLFDEALIELARQKVYGSLNCGKRKADALNSTIGWLCAKSQGFKESWNKASRDQRREWMKRVAG